MDHISQVVVKDKTDGHMNALTYRSWREALRGVAVEALEGLRGQFDAILCEGAGSSIEVNLQESGIADTGLAELVDLPVAITGGIDRGGILAHFVDTHIILSPEDRAWTTGFIVNRFRGGVSLLAPGLSVVHERTDVPVLGVVPFTPGP